MAGTNRKRPPMKTPCAGGSNTDARTHARTTMLTMWPSSLIALIASGEMGCAPRPCMNCLIGYEVFLCVHGLDDVCVCLVWSGFLDIHTCQYPNKSCMDDATRQKPSLRRPSLVGGKTWGPKREGKGWMGFDEMWESRCDCMHDGYMHTCMHARTHRRRPHRWWRWASWSAGPGMSWLRVCVRAGIVCDALN